jgi:hypothetical protein
MTELQVLTPKWAAAVQRLLNPHELPETLCNSDAPLLQQHVPLEIRKAIGLEVAVRCFIHKARLQVRISSHRAAAVDQLLRIGVEGTGETQRKACVDLLKAAVEELQTPLELPIAEPTDEQAAQIDDNLLETFRELLDTPPEVLDAYHANARETEQCP